MQLRNFITDDDAVSPVIGVILMVAITVILAAVIATFVLGLGDSVSNNAPQASFQFNPGSDEIIMTGGDELDGGNIEVTFSGSGPAAGSNIPAYSSSGGTSDVPSTITAGTDLNTGASLDFTKDTTIRVIWTNPNGGSTATIGTYNA